MLTWSFLRIRKYILCFLCKADYCFCVSVIYKQNNCLSACCDNPCFRLMIGVLGFCVGYHSLEPGSCTQKRFIISTFNFETSSIIIENATRWFFRDLKFKNVRCLLEKIETDFSWYSQINHLRVHIVKLLKRAHVLPIIYRCPNSGNNIAGSTGQESKWWNIMFEQFLSIFGIVFGV